MIPSSPNRNARRLIAALSVALGVQFACSDGPTGPKPTALQIVQQPSASAQTLVPLEVQPLVQLVDAGGNAIAQQGLIVTASVATGDGDVIAGATATTDAGGLAEFQNLTLGAEAGSGGSLTLRFASPGLTEATAPVELSCTVKPMTLGVEVADALVTGDCIRTSGSTVGSLLKHYDLNVPAPTKAVRITDTTTTFRPVVLVRGPNEVVRFFGAGAAGFGLSFKVLVPTGVHRVLATSVEPGTIGSFRLKVSDSPEDEPTCESVQLQSPVNTNQTLRGECADDAGNVGDFFPFVLSGTGSITVSATSAAFMPYVAIWRSDPNVREAFVTATGTTASVSYTNPGAVATIFYVFVGSSTGAATGAYSMQVTITNPTTGNLRALHQIYAPAPDRKFRGGRGQPR